MHGETTLAVGLGLGLALPRYFFAADLVMLPLIVHAGELPLVSVYGSSSADSLLGSSKVLNNYSYA